MPKIFWTYDEHRRLIPRIYELMEGDRNLTLLDATRLAQSEVLPPERQREIKAMSAMLKIERLLEDHRSNVRVASQVVETGEVGEKLRHTIQVGVEGTLRQIIRDELQIFEQRMLRHLGKAPLLKPVDAPVQAPHPTPPRDVTKLAKVLVVGLLSGQAQEIHRQFSARLELRFFDSQGVSSSSSYQRLDALSEACDATFGMVRFMRHGAENHINRKRYLRITGGTSMLAVALADYIKELEDGKARKAS